VELGPERLGAQPELQNDTAPALLLQYYVSHAFFFKKLIEHLKF
jgi:hypothetical protein